MHLVPLRPPLVAGPFARAVEAARRWPVDSQQRSRRNAMIASTALAQRRAELEDVEDFLAALRQDPAPEAAAQAAHG
jgi:hypothetical protein